MRTLGCVGSGLALPPQPVLLISRDTNHKASLVLQQLLNLPQHQQRWFCKSSLISSGPNNTIPPPSQLHLQAQQTQLTLTGIEADPQGKAITDTSTLVAPSIKAWVKEVPQNPQSQEGAPNCIVPKCHLKAWLQVSSLGKVMFPKRRSHVHNTPPGNPHASSGTSPQGGHH